MFPERTNATYILRREATVLVLQKALEATRKRLARASACLAILGASGAILFGTIATAPVHADNVNGSFPLYLSATNGQATDPISRGTPTPTRRPQSTSTPTPAALTGSNALTLGVVK